MKKEELRKRKRKYKLEKRKLKVPKLVWRILRKKTFLFFAKKKRSKLRKIKSIQGGKKMNEVLRRYTTEYLGKKFIEEMERLFKVVSPILAIPKATKRK
jgi:hypothetical protein